MVMLAIKSNVPALSNVSINGASESLSGMNVKAPAVVFNSTAYPPVSCKIIRTICGWNLLFIILMFSYQTIY